MALFCVLGHQVQLQQTQLGSGVNLRSLQTPCIGRMPPLSRVTSRVGTWALPNPNRKSSSNGNRKMVDSNYDNHNDASQGRESREQQGMSPAVLRRTVLERSIPGMGGLLLVLGSGGVGGVSRAGDGVMGQGSDMGAAAPTAIEDKPKEVKGQFGYLEDPILSYHYKYPTATANTKLKLVVSRKPEKYSSAAPLSSNFRHRIVNQMLDYDNVVVYAMYVCPSIGILKRFPPSDWTSQQVADTILLDRLNAKSIEEGRRYLEENVEGGAKYQDEDGTFYFQYEHLEPGAVRRGAQSEGRHNLAVTAARPGQDGSLYLFSLNMGCPEPLWDELSPLLYEAANSFRIDPLQSVSPQYVPPDKDPWAIL
eukprot:CAMPEP_0184490088 /NCGR_PEP_ID=MMETSP0113_2-20130426/17126_1 /TAXON_ID=91329 /ORGANISM="Norrisiella sphaerica, Strain BC52" /LENGTH=364 /DNA_ID=CAMNT_0026873837 /DNA_START=270 /DNA_END=1364 /DNA_ORIENTATION=-